jgi:dolichol-phosphate mannosyltransferase
MVPTYNEKENLPIILDRLFAATASVDVLVIDDASPDGTGNLADELSKTDKRISVLHRTGKLGLGSAYVAGFNWGIQHGYKYLVEMDADGSHPPETLPLMIDTMASRAAGGPALVVGSRWMKGGRVVDWPKSREALSRAANFYARIALGISVRDSTAGYRVYSADVLRLMNLGSVDSKGYCFQIDMTLRVLKAAGTVVEVPIVFRERQIGESKMSGSIIVEAMTKVTLWGFQRRFAQITGRAPRPS